MMQSGDDIELLEAVDIVEQDAGDAQGLLATGRTSMAFGVWNVAPSSC
jgi:hypothetical protein